MTTIKEEIITSGEKLQEYHESLGNDVEFGKHSEGKDTLYDMAYLLNPKTVAVSNNFKGNIDRVCLLLEDYNISHGITCDYGRISEGKDGMYSLISKLPPTVSGSVFVWDASVANPIKTYASNIVIGTGGGSVDYGDGTAPTSVGAGNIGLDHTYSDATKSYNVNVSNITIIGEYAFVNCTALTSIELPSATSIGDYAFIGCYELASVDLPSATSIGECAFSACTALTSIELPSATSIGEHAFRGCDELASVDLPSVTSIGEHAFRGCDELASVDLPSVTSIKYAAFSACTALTSIELPSATSIGDYAFIGCYELASVDLPSATSIGECAFSDCTALTSIKFALPTPPTVSSSNAWTKVPTTCKIYVPRGYLTAYKSQPNMPNPSTYTYVEYDP